MDICSKCWECGIFFDKYIITGLPCTWETGKGWEFNTRCKRLGIVQKNTKNGKNPGKILEPKIAEVELNFGYFYTPSNQNMVFFKHFWGEKKVTI